MAERLGYSQWRAIRREVEDYDLSPFACYLIAQNGDPRKLPC